MPSYYDIAIAPPAPPEEDIQNRPCSLVLTYANGTRSESLKGKVVGKPQANTVRIETQSAKLKGALGQVGGGTLTVETADGLTSSEVAAIFLASPEPASLAAADPVANGPSPIFGVNLTLNGTPVPIVADSLADIRKNGFKFELPQPVYLGTPDDFIAWIDSTFSVDLASILNPENLPGPIKDVVEKLLKVEITIVEAKVSVPGVEDTAGVTTYKLLISAKFPGDGIPLIPGSTVLMLNGGSAGVISNPPPA